MLSAISRNSRDKKESKYVIILLYLRLKAIFSISLIEQLYFAKVMRKEEL